MHKIATGATGAKRPTAKGVTFHEPLAGANVDDTVARIVDQARSTGRTVVAKWNGFRLTANPGDTVQQVRKPLDESSKKRHEQTARRQQKVALQRQQKLAALDRPLVHTAPRGMSLDPRGSMEGLRLITPAQLKVLPRGTVLRRVSGAEAVVGVDRIYGDTRGGFLSYGFATDRPRTAAQ